MSTLILTLIGQLWLLCSGILALNYTWVASVYLLAALKSKIHNIEMPKLNYCDFTFITVVGSLLLSPVMVAYMFIALIKQGNKPEIISLISAGMFVVGATLIVKHIFFL